MAWGKNNYNRRGAKDAEKCCLLTATLCVLSDLRKVVIKICREKIVASGKPATDTNFDFSKLRWSKKVKDEIKIKVKAKVYPVELRSMCSTGLRLRLRIRIMEKGESRSGAQGLSILVAQGLRRSLCSRHRARGDFLVGFVKKTRQIRSQRSQRIHKGHKDYACKMR
jgi:hypothetical protein